MFTRVSAARFERPAPSLSIRTRAQSKRRGSSVFQTDVAWSDRRRMAPVLGRNIITSRGNPQSQKRGSRITTGITSPDEYAQPTLLHVVSRGSGRPRRPNLGGVLATGVTLPVDSGVGRNEEEADIRRDNRPIQARGLTSGRPKVPVKTIQMTRGWNQVSATAIDRESVRGGRQNIYGRDAHVRKLSLSRPSI